jgi:transposase
MTEPKPWSRRALGIDRRNMASKALSKARMKDVVYLREQGLTFRKIAEMLGISSSRAEQLARKYRNQCVLESGQKDENCQASE